MRCLVSNYVDFSVKNINIRNNKITSVECIIEGQLQEIAGDIFISSILISGNSVSNSDIIAC